MTTRRSDSQGIGRSGFCRSRRVPAVVTHWTSQSVLSAENRCFCGTLRRWRCRLSSVMTLSLPGRSACNTETSMRTGGVSLCFRYEHGCSIESTGTFCAAPAARTRCLKSSCYSPQSFSCLSCYDARVHEASVCYAIALQLTPVVRLHLHNISCEVSALGKAANDVDGPLRLIFPNAGRGIQSGAGYHVFEVPGSASFFPS